MTEAMKSMDSGMAAAEIELRAARRAVPAAVPAEASALLQPSAPPGSNTKLAADAASGDGTDSKQSQDSTAPVQKLNLPQPSGQQQTPTSQTDQGNGQPTPVTSGSHGKAEQRDREGSCVSENATTIAAKGVSLQAEAGSKAEPTAAVLPQQSSGHADLSPATPIAQQSQHPQAAADTNDQLHAVKVSKQVTGVQLRIHADSSAGQGSHTRLVPTSSSSGPKATSACLLDVSGQTTPADSTAQGVTHALTVHASTGHASPPINDGSTPVQSGQVHPSVDAPSEAPKVPTAGAMQCPASPVSSAVDLARGSSSNAAAVSAARQAGSAASAVGRSEVSQQQGAAEEPWAAEEGDFADMLKDFLVHLAALSVSLFLADSCDKCVSCRCILCC